MQLVQHPSIGRTSVMIVLGAIAGYVTLALTSTVVQEVWLGGVSYRNSARSTLILAGVFTPLCAVMAGFVSAVIARQGRWLAAGLTSTLIAVETTFLYVSERVDGPLWFEASAGLALIAGIIAGTWLGSRALLQTAARNI